MRRSVCALVAAGLMLLDVVGGAAGVRAQGSSASSSDADVAALRERAAAFWAARVTGDAEGQWQLLEPRGKGRVTAQEYGKVGEGGRYLAYQVEGATINGFFATVKVKLLVQQILPLSARSRVLPPQAVVLDDGWIRIGGIWYRRTDSDETTPTQAHQP